MPSPSLLQALGVILQNRQATRTSALQNAIDQAKQTYPRFKDMPLALTMGVPDHPNSGYPSLGTSETFQPTDKDNPRPGNVTVELRQEKAMRDPSTWAPIVSLEALHGLQENDPIYQLYSNQLQQSFTPEQQASNRRVYERDKQSYGVTEPYSTYLPHVQDQEWMRGLLFKDFFDRWNKENGLPPEEWSYTSKQRALGQKVDKYLRSSE